MERGRSTKRRDQLLEMQHQAQKWWEDAHVFNAEANDQPPKEGDKFFGTFPFPYMNGYLHLGHAFSLSKLEFAAAYHRLKGANVLLPFAFHCTGMPIKASADKLKREIERFGNPPCFPPEPQVKQVKPSHSDQFKGKKSKAASKTGKETYQWEIMRGYGLSDSEIATFQDPIQWLRFFPPLAIEDLKAFGLGADWRRSFITTDHNPYFDSFVRWQMRKLKEKGKIVKDVRYTIYSPLDGQPCADHDRSSGEGVIPQEYTLIKMEVIPPYPPKFSFLEGNKKVYLAAATLRPETMYGQTNAWVLPDGKYGAFDLNESDVDSEVLVLTARAARNLEYQRHVKPTCLVELTGQDLIGLPLKSPLSFNQIIYCLPMLSVLTDKGTGIVTSVPSDSPDDFMALQDLKSKAPLRAKFSVKDEWVLPFEVIPIISHPEFGDKSAEKICTDLKIKSQNEREKLDKAKNVIYKGGFYEGTMIAGEYAGMRVQEAKTLIRTKLLELKQAVVYCEPEKKVMSRSGDECVVALTDQWYLTYGESTWRKHAEDCLKNMNLYSDETRHGFESTLTWLNQWACSRSFGLGSRIPWDDEFLVESLSDSTIYMAYYTVSHLLQKGELFGHDTSSVKPEDLTDEVWDYLFLSGPKPNPESCNIPLTFLEKMKREFEYWYPVDLRVSGKDLIQNHLTFSIYNHTTIFPKRHWPRGFRCNGHIMLNSEKMSKSTGNFKTLKQAIEEFSADATRFTLADAGDGMDDANFAFETVDSAIRRLTKEREWMEEEVLGVESSFRTGPPSSFADRVFANEIDFAVKTTEKNYGDYMFREALKTGFYDLQKSRDEYRDFCKSEGVKMNRDILWRFMDVQTRLIAPICPHYSEYIWKKLLKKPGFVIKAGWPECKIPDLTLQMAKRYLRDSISHFSKLYEKQVSGGSKKGKTDRKPTIGLIFVNEEYEGWKKECLTILRDKFDTQNCKFTRNEEILEALQKTEFGEGLNCKQIQKVCGQFLNYTKGKVMELGVEALDLRLPFGEIKVLQENLELVKRKIGVEHVEILSANDENAVVKAGRHGSLLKQAPPSPGSPTAIFLTQEDMGL